jgi:hypothetical protein
MCPPAPNPSPIRRYTLAAFPITAARVPSFGGRRVSFGKWNFGYLVAPGRHPAVRTFRILTMGQLLKNNRELGRYLDMPRPPGIYAERPWGRTAGYTGSIHRLPS